MCSYDVSDYNSREVGNKERRLIKMSLSWRARRRCTDRADNLPKSHRGSRLGCKSLCRTKSILTAASYKSARTHRALVIIRANCSQFAPNWYLALDNEALSNYNAGRSDSFHWPSAQTSIEFKCELGPRKLWRLMR